MEMNIKNCWYKDRCTNNCTESCIRYRLMKSLYQQSRLPQSMWKYKKLVCDDLDLEAFKELNDISHNMKDFVRNGKNICIYSENCGNGKTSWAIRLLFEYFNDIWHESHLDMHGLFVNVPNFMYNCKRSISQDVKGFEQLCNDIEKADIVIWDDICSSPYTAYEHDILLQYVDGRINSGKSNIFTGNQNEEHTSDMIGKRLSSRIFGCSKVFHFREGDKRTW